MSGGYQIVKAAVTCDLPARCRVLNMRQFNGSQGCHLCEDTGANDGMFRWWPHNRLQVLRSRQSLVKDAIEATKSDEMVVVSVHGSIGILIHMHIFLL